MTETEKSPLRFDVVRESSTFIEEKTVSNKELVIITSANENLYLNIVVKKVGEEDIYSAVFQPWSDYKDIDLNAWFTIEHEVEDDGKTRLKHFSTEQYLIVINKKGVKDVITLGERSNENSELTFKTIDVDELGILNYDSDVIFKIKSTPGEDKKSRSYLRMADEDDKKKLVQSNQLSEVLDLNINESTVPLVVKQKCKINLYDTFNLEFPLYNTNRDLIFCKDIKAQLGKIGYMIMLEEDKWTCLKENNDAIGRTFINIYSFLNNKLEGMIHADYLIGENVKHRQKMFHMIELSGDIF